MGKLSHILKVHGVPYVIRTQANYYVMVMSKEHMTELGEASELSLRAAFGDVSTDSLTRFVLYSSGIRYLP